MTSARKRLTAEENHALAATPLPFAVIWSEKDFEEFLKAAERDATKTYLGLLSGYRRILPHNNPIYNDVEQSEKQGELLTALRINARGVPHDEPELYAATLNLYALLLKDTKNFQTAVGILELALQIKNLSPLSLASLSHTLAGVYSQEKNVDASLAKLTNAAKFLEQVELSYAVDMHIAACIYSSLGNALYDKGDISRAREYHLRAIALWPENNVIANNAAIFLSKQHSLEDLQKADEMLAIHYEKAKEDKVFVTPYYRTDVNIKLAGFAKEAGNEVLAARYVRDACAYWTVANTAINTNYSGSYKNKGLARLEYLGANLAYIDQDYHELERHKAEATSFRQQVKEPAAKFEKFIAKFPTQTPFSTQGLYRRKPAPVTLVADDKTEKKLSL
jgi:tetratricopeptide (TPR) repeat protein